MRITQNYINRISYEVIGCAIEVHKHLGPGLLESIYERCLIYELRQRGLDAKSQVGVPVIYKGEDMGEGLRMDILVNDILVVELKAVEKMIPLFDAQLLTYLKLTSKPKGLLINFNCLNISNEVISLVSEHFADLPKE